MNENENALVRQLILEKNDLECQVKSFSLQLNHVSLQVQALRSSERELSVERDKLLYEAAINSQNIKLLEAKIRDIAGFENITPNSFNIVKDKLIEEINEQVAAIHEEKQMLELQLRDIDLKRNNEINNLKFKTQSYSDQIKSLTEELSQQAIIYTAREKSFDSEIIRLRDENANFRNKFEFYESRIEQLVENVTGNNDRIDDLNKELSEERSRSNELSQHMLQLQEFNSSLNEELTEALSTNHTLSLLNDRLRSSGVDDVEREYNDEIAAMKSSIRFQVDELQQKLSSMNEAYNREVVLNKKMQEEIDRLKQYSASVYNQLLDSQQQYSSLSKLDNSGVIDEEDLESIDKPAYRNIQNDVSEKVESMDRFCSAFFSETNNNKISLGMIRNLIPFIDELLPKFMASIIIFAEKYAEMFSTRALETRSDSGLSCSFLVGFESVQSSHDGDISALEKSSLESTVDSLKDHIQIMQIKEKKLKSQLAMVLEKAGSLGMTVEDKRVLSQKIIEQDGEISKLKDQQQTLNCRIDNLSNNLLSAEEQISYYQESLKEAEKNIQASKRLARHEAATEYSSQILELQSLVSNAQVVISGLESEVAYKKLELSQLREENYHISQELETQSNKLEDCERTIRSKNSDLSSLQVSLADAVANFEKSQAELILLQQTKPVAKEFIDHFTQSDCSDSIDLIDIATDNPNFADKEMDELLRSQRENLEDAFEIKFRNLETALKLANLVELEKNNEKYKRKIKNMKETFQKELSESINRYRSEFDNLYINSRIPFPELLSPEGTLEFMKKVLQSYQQEELKDLFATIGIELKDSELGSNEMDTISNIYQQNVSSSLNSFRKPNPFRASNEIRN